MSSPEQLLNDIELHIRRLFEVHHNPKLTYHNFSHTQSVVRSTELMAAHYQLSGDDLLVLRISAWFHDTGFLFESPSLHEEKSALLAETYLKEKNVNATVIQRVSNCILATKLPQSPVDLTEQILCDADLFNLGSADFREMAKLLKKEIEALSEEEIKNSTWREQNIQFLESHDYFTGFARSLLNSGKKEHIEELKTKSEEKAAKKLAKQKQKEEEVIAEDENSPHEISPDTESDKEQEKKIKKQKQVKLERGVETMFRVTYSNHSQISSMADSKANILISITSISISVVISLFIPRLEEFPYLIIPTVFFLVSCLIAMTMAILCTRPNLTPPANSAVEEKRKTNLLFFGNFYHMQLQEYENAMEEMIKNGDEVYTNLTRNLYYLGLVLKRKYKLLHYAYSTFMYGIIISVISFLIAAALTNASISKLF